MNRLLYFNYMDYHWASCLDELLICFLFIFLTISSILQNCLFWHRIMKSSVQKVDSKWSTDTTIACLSLHSSAWTQKHFKIIMLMLVRMSWVTIIRRLNLSSYFGQTVHYMFIPMLQLHCNNLSTYSFLQFIAFTCSYQLSLTLENKVLLLNLGSIAGTLQVMKYVYVASTVSLTSSTVCECQQIFTTLHIL